MDGLEGVIGEYLTKSQRILNMALSSSTVDDALQSRINYIRQLESIISILLEDIGES